MIVAIAGTRLATSFAAVPTPPESHKLQTRSRSSLTNNTAWALGAKELKLLWPACTNILHEKLQPDQA